jgi:two-component system, sensor histidine kinase
MDVESTHLRWPAPKRYAIAVGILMAALGMRLALLPAGSGLGYLTFYPAMMGIFWLCGTGPGLCMAIVSAMLAGYWFFPPYGAFGTGPVEAIATVAYLLSNGLLAWITHAVHRHAAASEARYRAVVEDQTEVISRYRPDGTLVFVNQAFCRLVGREADDLVGRPWSPLAVPEDLPLVERELRRLSPDAPVVTIENRILTAAQEIRWCQFVTRAIFDADGQLLEIQSVGRDISERKTMEAALEEATASAVHANEVKSRFLAAASHDLRQPLQTIWTLQNVLCRAYGAGAHHREIALLGEAVQSIDNLLSALIDVNRLKLGAIEPIIRNFTLSPVLGGLRSEFDGIASGKGIRLDIAESAELVRSDPVLLPVALRHLIDNAIKHTADGCVRLGVRVGGERVQIDVVDTGQGLTSAELRKLRDGVEAPADAAGHPGRDARLARPERSPGLSVVHHICRRLRHGISADSGFDTGTTVTIDLERVTAAPSQAGAEAESRYGRQAGPNAGPGKSILHIEDDPGLARSMEMLLTLEGYDVTEAASRDEALNQVVSCGLRPDLILCDFQLPLGYTGDVIVNEISGHLGYRPPTIILTGDIANQHIKAAETVADRVFPKPVDVNVLLREFGHLLAAHRPSR